jgi:hypothetical protein
MGFFDISGDVIKQAEAAAGFQLVIPATAKMGKDGSASWTEHGRVTEAFSETFDVEIEGRKMDNLVLTVKMEIDAEGSNVNAGNTFRNQIRINKIALQTGKMATAGSPLKKQHTMSQMSIHKLKMVMKACRIEPDTEDGGYSQTLLSECFPDVGNFSGEPSPLIGNSFWFEVRKTESDGKKDGRKFTNYEIAQIVDQ